MPGFSLTVLLLPRDGCPDSGIGTTSEVLDLLDAQCDVPGWCWHSKREASRIITVVPPVVKDLGYEDTDPVSVRRAYTLFG